MQPQALGIALNLQLRLNKLLPLLTLPLALNLLFVALPGLVRGTPGAKAACSPMVLIPAMSVATAKADALLAASGYAPSPEDLSAITQLHTFRACVSFFSFCLSISDFSTKFHTAILAFKAKWA